MTEKLRLMGSILNDLENGKLTKPRTSSTKPRDWGGFQTPTDHSRHLCYTISLSPPFSHTHTHTSTTSLLVYMYYYYFICQQNLTKYINTPTCIIKHSAPGTPQLVTLHLFMILTFTKLYSTSLHPFSVFILFLSDSDINTLSPPPMLH